MERGEGKDRGVRRAHPDQDFVLQWGYPKRLRCVKPQVKDEAANEKAKESYVLRRQPSRHDHPPEDFNLMDRINLIKWIQQ